MASRFSSIKKRSFEEENSIIFNQFRLYTSLNTLNNKTYKKGNGTEEYPNYICLIIILFYCIKLSKIDYIFNIL